MAEEHITTVDPDRGGATHTTIVTDDSRRGGGSGWLIGIVLLIAVIAAIWSARLVSCSACLLVETRT